LTRLAARFDDARVISTIGGYAIKARIAQGGMAEVFLGLQQGPHGFERMVAVKRLLPQLEDEPGFAEMLVEEARIAACLQHPNICQIFHVGAEGGRHYIVMEYLSGKPLGQIWKRGAKRSMPLPPALGAYAVARAAEGLAYAHEKADLRGRPLSIVHRDVSPENIFVTYDGQVKVLDFGIAKAANRVSRTRTGVVRGKIAYMSPEQVRALSLDGRSDIFSLGIVLHEVLVGKALFQSENDLRTMREVLGAPIPPMPGVSEAIREVAFAALERDRDRRLPTAREFARRLDAAVGRESPPPGAQSLAEYLGRIFEGEMAQEADLVRRIARGEEVVVSDEAVPMADATATRPGGGTRPLSDSWRRLTHRSKRLAGGAAAIALIGAVAGGAWFALRPAASTTLPAEAQADPPALAVSAVPNAAPSEPAAPKLPVTPEPTPPAVPAVRSPEPGVKKESLSAPVRHPRPHARGTRSPKQDPGATQGPAETTVAGTGRLTLDTFPWTEIFLGNRRLGTTPLFEVNVPAGHHRLHAVNSDSHVDRTIDVDIRPGETTSRKESW
jgi:eukaryotic-like serine/threonine-protein kinase